MQIACPETQENAMSPGRVTKARPLTARGEHQVTAINITTTSAEISKLIDLLWDGKISEDAFTKDAHQLGASIARIEYEIEQLKISDGVL
jgi:hypothetical protein